MMVFFRRTRGTPISGRKESSGLDIVASISNGQFVTVEFDVLTIDGNVPLKVFLVDLEAQTELVGRLVHPGLGGDREPAAGVEYDAPVLVDGDDIGVVVTDTECAVAVAGDLGSGLADCVYLTHVSDPFLGRAVNRTAQSLESTATSLDRLTCLQKQVKGRRNEEATCPVRCLPLPLISNGDLAHRPRSLTS